MNDSTLVPMRSLRDISIRWKLTAALLLTGLFGIAASGVAILAYEVSSSRRDALKELNMIAEILAENNAGALAFGDAASAQRTLETLGDDPAVEAARIFTENGNVLASYRHRDSQEPLPNSPEPPSSTIQGDRLRVYRFVVLKGQVLGTVFLQSNLSLRSSRLEEYTSIALLAMGMICLAVLGLSIPLQRFLSDPILYLARVARDVTAKRDFSIRIKPLGNDEIGFLGHTLNDMFKTLEDRDSALRNANQILQAEVSHRRQTEATLLQIRQRLELSQQVGNIGTWEWDMRTGKATWTEELESIFGLPKGSFEGTREAWLEKIIPEDRERAAADLQRAIDGEGQYDSEFRLLTPHGQRRWVTSRGRVFHDLDGKPHRALGVAYDITAIKEAEEKLTQQAEELWRSNRELEQFAYVSSHDLKEPLRKIASYTQLLDQRAGEKLDADSRHYLDHIQSGVNRMQALIQDLLIYSRTGKEQMKWEQVDMRKVFHQTLDDLEPAIKETGAVITADELPVIEAHAAQMEQLLQNLISNSIKYHRDAPPRIHMRAKKEDGHWVFEVRDNGIGIEAKYQDQIFKIFQRLHNQSKYPGTGIGLAICKKILERHGGEIWVKSEPGGGASFFFRVPEKAPSIPQIQPAFKTGA